MKVVFTRAVTKDVQSIRDEKLKVRIRKLTEDLKKAESVQEISGLKKMKGHPDAYRIRVGGYRMGILSEDGTVILMRFLKRADIYKVFP